MENHGKQHAAHENMTPPGLGLGRYSVSDENLPVIHSSGERGHPPPSNAAPVAWRTRDRNVPNQVWTLWNQEWEPTHGELNLRYTYDTSDLDAEVQPLFTRPNAD